MEKVWQKYSEFGVPEDFIGRNHKAEMPAEQMTSSLAAHTFIWFLTSNLIAGVSYPKTPNSVPKDLLIRCLHGSTIAECQIACINNKIIIQCIFSLFISEDHAWKTCGLEVPPPPHRTSHMALGMFKLFLQFISIGYIYFFYQNHPWKYWPFNSHLRRQPILFWILIVFLLLKQFWFTWYKKKTVVFLLWP